MNTSQMFQYPTASFRNEATYCFGLEAYDCMISSRNMCFLDSVCETFLDEYVDETFLPSSFRVMEGYSVTLVHLIEKIEKHKEQISCYQQAIKCMIQLGQQKKCCKFGLKGELFTANQKVKEVSTQLRQIHKIKNKMRCSVCGISTLLTNKELCHLYEGEVKKMEDLLSDFKSICSDLLHSLSGVSLNGTRAAQKVHAQLRGNHVLVKLVYKICKVCICSDFSKTFPQVICPTHSMHAKTCSNYHYQMFGHMEFLKSSSCKRCTSFQYLYDNYIKSFSSVTKSCEHVCQGKSQFRHSFRCQCGKCSLVALFDQSCPNSFDPAFSSEAYACFGVEAGSDSTLPADRGIFLQPSVKQTLVGVPRQKFSANVCSMEREVKDVHGFYATHRLVAPGRTLLTYGQLPILNLVFNDSSLSCNDQIFHTACCMSSDCNNTSYSLNTEVRSRWHLCSTTKSTTCSDISLSCFLELLSALQQCALDFFAALITLLLIILAGDVELNPGPLGKFIL